MNRITELRKQKNKSMMQVSKELNIPYTTFVNYEKGEREPNSEMLIELANYFSVTVDYLIGRSDDIPTDRDASLPDNILPLPATVRRPRLGVISCGDPVMSEENFDGYDDVPVAFGDCDYTLICDGDSMIGARIHDGDVVYIKQQSIVDNGQIAAILVDGTDTLLKRVYLTDDSVILQAENPLYSPRVFVKEEMNRVRIIGRAIGFSSIIK